MMGDWVYCSMFFPFFLLLNIHGGRGCIAKIEWMKKNYKRFVVGSMGLLFGQYTRA
jgi:hypothetical protein